MIWGVSNFFAGQSATATSSGGSVTFEYVTVYSGDTLWSIAEEHAPNQDPSDYVQKIIDLNNLQSVNVNVGQQLALPNN
jgi:LysM repeat protein